MRRISHIAFMLLTTLILWVTQMLFVQADYSHRITACK